MTEQEFQERIVNATFARMRQILEQKGKEYAGDLAVDRLANFKGVAAGCNIGVLQCWHVYAAKHWRAIENYIRVGEVRSEESIEGRFHDLLNYLILGLAIIVDKQDEQHAEKRTAFLNKLDEARDLVNRYGGDLQAGQNKALVNPVEAVMPIRPLRKGPHHVTKPKSNGKSSRRNS